MTGVDVQEYSERCFKCTERRTRMAFARLLISLLLLGLASHANALDKGTCTQEQAIAAEDQASQASTWGQLFQGFSNFANCDDGAIAEGFDESVDRLLATKNPNYDEFAALVSLDYRFKAFVLRHVAGTGTGDAILAAGRNALACYTRSKMPICRDVSLSVAEGFEDAVREISGMQKNGTASQDQLEWKVTIQQFVIDCRRAVAHGSK